MSPAARRLAEAHGIDLSTVTGSGPAGAIVYADVERRLGEAVAPPEKKRAPGLDLDAMRSAIAAAMARSKREIPHYYLEHQVDVTACEQWLTRTNAARPPDDRLLIGALAIKSVALAARRFPAFNGFYRDGKFEPASAVHVGVAIAIRGGGLAAPALHEADQILARRADGAYARPRSTYPCRPHSQLGDFRSDDHGHELSGNAVSKRCTASSIRRRWRLSAIGKVVTRPWVIDGAIGPRSVVTITLSADHRVSDGHAGALFLAEIGRLLQEPDKL